MGQRPLFAPLSGHVSHELCRGRDVRYSRAHHHERLAARPRNVRAAGKATGVPRAQVGLDGPPDVHDVMRPGANRRGDVPGKSSRTSITPWTSSPVAVRVNIDRSNYGRVEELLRDPRRGGGWQDA